MKRVGVIVGVSLLACLCVLNSVLAVYRPAQVRPVAPPPTSPYDDAQVGDRGTAAGTPDVGRPQDVDPNKVRAAVKAFKGLDVELEQVERKSTTEITQWTSDKEDNRTALMRAVDDQVRVELAMLRKIAAEERANKTLAAIDGVLLNRQVRIEKINDRMRKMRSEQPRTRTPRGRTPIRGRSDTRDIYQGGAGAGGAAAVQPVTPDEQGQPRRYPPRRR